MNDKKIKHNPDRTISGLYGIVNSDVTFYFVLTAVIFLSYGYELFNFNLTIDEELHANHYSKWHQWIGQGRWGMALLNLVVVPNAVVPVVSMFLGVIGLVVGIVLLLKTSFKIDRIGILSISALAITIPTLSFTFTFSTLAYGVGFAFVALALSNLFIYKKSYSSVILACLLAAFAISVYQTFVFALAMLAIVYAWHDHADSTFTVFEKYKYACIYFFGGVLTYVVLNFVALKITSSEVVYVGQFVDLNGFFQAPIKKTISSLGKVLKILSLRPGQFGIHSIWLSVIVVVSIVFSFIYPLINKANYTRVYTGAILMTVLIVMALADAISQYGAPLRSLVYFPVAIVIIVACAYTVSGKVGRLILIGLCMLTVIGNSQVNNHLFASSTSAEFKDRMLADTIINEVRRLKPDNSDYSVLKVEVVGNRSWPANGIQSKSETFGASFFEWDGGNRYRVASYLNLNGLASIGASVDDRLRVYGPGKAMPIWPHAGWIAITDDIVILKFGEYSRPQKISLCTSGVEELCD